MMGWTEVAVKFAPAAALGMLDLSMHILKLLAVVGGAAVGGFGSGLLLRLLVRLALHRPVPRRMLIPVQVLGAVALGLAVWLWVFGTGGSGLGMGGLFGLGGNAGTGAGTDTESNSDNAKKAKSGGSQHPADDSSSPVAETLRIVMLGGQRVKEQRFYLVGDDGQPKTLSEVRQSILTRQQDKDRHPWKGIEIVIYENSVVQDHPAVKELEKLARDHDLAVKLSFPKGNGQ